MPHFFDISFPFGVTECNYNIGEYPALCHYTIPLCQTDLYQCPAKPGLAFARQFYGNKLTSIDLFDCNSPESFELSISQEKRPAYVLVVVLDGSLRYFDAQKRQIDQPQAGTCYMARMGGREYSIHIPKGKSRLLLISIHPDQLAVFGEDFRALRELLDAALNLDYCITDHKKADRKFMLRLMRLLTPALKRRKDFNIHLLEQLPGVISYFKGLLLGKDQESYDKKQLHVTIAYIDQEMSLHGRPPSLAEVLKHTVISVDKLEALFKEETGITLQEHLQILKMDAIKEEIIHSTKPIYQIADEFGYSDTAALNKPFKKQFGHSPQYYRRRNR